MGHFKVVKIERSVLTVASTPMMQWCDQDSFGKTKTETKTLTFKTKTKTETLTLKTETKTKTSGLKTKTETKTVTFTLKTGQDNELAMDIFAACLFQGGNSQAVDFAKILF